MYKYKKALGSLQEFIRLMNTANVTNKKAYSQWAKENKEKLEKLFWYKQKNGMPPIHSLVGAFFHPTLPLIGLNYTPAAHNTLYAFPNGWTKPLRLCRGIVFDYEANLIALPFPKFFNYNEHKETMNLPNQPFAATEKYDGHLGIIFEYNGQILLTTRGDFTSRTSALGNDMLKLHIADCDEHHGDWRKKYPKDITSLVEIIHEKTKVFIDYKDCQFVIIGASNRKTLEDYNHKKLSELGRILWLDVTKCLRKKSLNELVVLMKDRSITNKEGYVLRFQNGLRVKLKFETYIAKMVESKLSYTYLMNRIMKGNLKKMIEILPEEIYKTALQMLGEILLIASAPITNKEKWQQLYALVPPEKSTPYYRNICRKFIKQLGYK